MEQRDGLAVVGHYVGSFGIGGRPSRRCCSLNHDLLLNHICPHDDDDDDDNDEDLPLLDQPVVLYSIIILLIMMVMMMTMIPLTTVRESCFEFSLRESNKRKTNQQDRFQHLFLSENALLLFFLFFKNRETNQQNCFQHLASANF